MVTFKVMGLQQIVKISFDKEKKISLDVRSLVALKLEVPKCTV